MVLSREVEELMRDNVSRAGQIEERVHVFGLEL